jgi:hypothetical protein
VSYITVRASLEEIGIETMLAPKEQPPWKLSGERTATRKLWKVAREVPADGITFSGATDREGD